MRILLAIYTNSSYQAGNLSHPELLWSCCRT
jgi:hypothetical protein